MGDVRTKLINLMVAMRRVPPLSELDGEEERLLFEVFHLAPGGQAIPMTDLYDLLGRKSRSTSYRTLVALREKGLVEFATDDGDKRKRFVTITDRAHQMFRAFA